MKNQKIDFKHPRNILHGLDTALKKEKQKYSQSPVVQDLMPSHNMAQAWGYVVAGYFLVEMSFKALLFVRDKEVERKHSLTIPFGQFGEEDQELLREYFADFRNTVPNGNTFPFETLDDFLVNLDGDLNPRKSDYMGSFDWRYHIIEKHRQKMPFIGIEFLHEVAYGATRIFAYVHNSKGDPSRLTRSWRIRRNREAIYQDWLMVRMNSDGWKDLGDRLEILWGPDYRGRHDWILFEGRRSKHYFAKLPERVSLPIVDKRSEIEGFDVEKKIE